MAKMTPAGDAARQALASIPELTGGGKPIGELSDSYAQRLLGSVQRQLAAGLTPSRQAARGHVLTPEHPRSARPILPEPATRYSPRATQTSKYAPRDVRPAPGRRHTRQRGRSHIPYQDDGEIYTRNSEREAREVLAYADALEPVGSKRVVIQVYDCSLGGRSGNTGWFPFLSHTWHAGGISISDLYRLWDDHGGSLERFMMDTINGKDGRGDSDPKAGSGPITHICQYEITILPSARTLRRA